MSSFLLNNNIIIDYTGQQKQIEMVSRQQTSFEANLRGLNLKMTSFVFVFFG